MFLRTQNNKESEYLHLVRVDLAKRLIAMGQKYRVDMNNHHGKLPLVEGNLLEKIRLYSKHPIDYMGQNNLLGWLPRRWRYALWRGPYTQHAQARIAKEDFKHIMAFNGGALDRVPPDLYAPFPALIAHMRGLLKIYKSQFKMIRAMEDDASKPRCTVARIEIDYLSLNTKRMLTVNNQIVKTVMNLLLDGAKSVKK